MTDVKQRELERIITSDTIWSDLPKGGTHAQGDKGLSVIKLNQCCLATATRLGQTGAFFFCFMSPLTKAIVAIGCLLWTLLPTIHPLPSSQPITNGCSNCMSIGYYEAYP